MYQALYRKYRPQTFDDVVGQNVITTTLKNQVITGKLSHAYLFTGTHGTGKTTCAKILAKAVNCENPIDGNPCNCCPSCRGIDAGNILDVQEIDAASNNGVDSVRDLQDEMVYLPAEVKKRVYIIDEVHMLSTNAFNALLKTIEEPPEHLMFIFATTELNKVPSTIRSRCQRFSFRRPTVEDISGRIRYVAYQEGINLEPDAADLLGRLANGAFRDGLSLLDQCAGAASGRLDTTRVCEVLGLAGQEKTAELMGYIGDRNTAGALQVFSELYSGGKDIAALLNEIGTLARDMLIVRTAPKSGLEMISTICTVQELQELMKKFTPEELLRIVEQIQETTNGFRNSANQRLDGELCLIHMCNIDLSAEPVDLSARISRVEENLAQRITELEQKLRSGKYTVTIDASEDADENPAEESDEIAEAPEEASQAVAAQPKQAVVKSDESWKKIRERALADLPPLAHSYIERTEGYVKGDTLYLMPGDAISVSIIKRYPEIVETIEKKAQVVLGKPATVRLTNESSGDSGGDSFSGLVSSMEQFDNIVIKK